MHARHQFTQSWLETWFGRDNGSGEETAKKVPYGLSAALFAWYRSLTSELEACGLEQVKAHRCLYVRRHPSIPGRSPGIIGAHVDDLLIAGCANSIISLFEFAMKKLTTRLQLGDASMLIWFSCLYGHQCSSASSESCHSAS